jgi:membrane protein CcdC involved in cytochrome C biogenesis
VDLHLPLFHIVCIFPNFFSKIIDVYYHFNMDLIFTERSKQIANLILVVLMIGAIYAHWAVDDKLERSAPALVFFFMLTCRLVVEWQVSRKAATPKASATNETSTEAIKKSGKNE